jgi:protein TonB
MTTLSSTAVPPGAKLARPDIAPARVERSLPSPSSSMSTVAMASLAIHGGIALALISLPMPTSISRELEESWLSFELETVEVAPPTPEPIAAPAPLPEPVAVRERTVRQPRPAAPIETHAPPSVDDVFAEPAPPAPTMTTETAGAGFAVAPGEAGGVPGGTVGGHGTSIGAVAAAPAVEAGPSEADRRRARRGYVQAIEQLLHSHTRYPRAAAREGLQGRVELAMRIGNDGHVLAIRVASTSGHGILDDAALDAAREIGRVPAPPMLASLTSTDEVRVGVVYLVR